jgi:hypothetical protein
LTAGIKWYEEVNAPIPEAGTDFDPATHKLGPLDWVYDDIEETATATHTIVALTQAELDELAKHASMAAEMDQAKAIYQDLKNGVGTAGERMARLEKVTARLLREFIDG